MNGGNEVDLDSKLNHMTTLIVTETLQQRVQGSGFFYSVSDLPDPGGPKWTVDGTVFELSLGCLGRPE